MIEIVLATVLTFAAFALTRWIGVRTGNHPFVNPILFAAIIVLVMVYAAGFDYQSYSAAAKPLRWLLGPSIVALAIPIWRQRRRLAQDAGLILSTVVGTAILGATLGAGAAWLLGLPPGLVLALSTKTTTSPFAIKIMDLLGGPAVLAAVFIALAGTVAAIFLPGALTMAKITDPAARGIALGGAGHIIGTQRAMEEGPVSGSMAALAMALMGLVTAVIVPLGWRLFVH
jgi:putative effector of murein hydrolase